MPIQESNFLTLLGSICRKFDSIANLHGLVRERRDQVSLTSKQWPVKMPRGQKRSILAYHLPVAVTCHIMTGRGLAEGALDEAAALFTDDPDISCHAANRRHGFAAAWAFFAQ